METITLNKKQQRRAEVLGKTASGAISKSDAENLLGLGRRQIDRLLKNFEEKGLSSVVHGNSGRVPVNKTPQPLMDRVIELAGEDGKYHRLNACHLHDLLEENEEILISRPVIYRGLIQSGVIRLGKQTSAVRRQRRERATREGMLLQIDGSPHDWLCGRGPKMALVGAIDDATGRIVYGTFRPTEDQAGYIMMLRSIAQTYGLPGCLYHDRHTILRSPKEQTIEDELADRIPQSQVQRIMTDLGIRSIPAHSPQAKGRVERLWRTLQDRLIKEMTIAGICSISEANAFLPGFIVRFNKRFAKEPADGNCAWVAIDTGMDMHYCFSTSDLRVVRPDHTISYKGKTLQILRDKHHPILVGKRVDVRVSPEGDIRVYIDKHRLSCKNIESRPTISSKVKEKTKTESKDLIIKETNKGWLYGFKVA
jgi:hypothetical protein